MWKAAVCSGAVLGASLAAPAALAQSPDGTVPVQVVTSRTTQVVQTQTTQKPSDQRTWAQKMFSELEHDFGNVAAGADVQHTLTITNPYQETVRIVGVDKTCGCTGAEVSKNEIGTHESATIDIAMDTKKFRDEKKSNVLVTLAFTHPSGVTQRETVRIPIRAFIRKDVVVEPGGANFGNVAIGAGGEQTLTIKYAGRPDWAIDGVDSSSPHVDVQLGERVAAGGRVEYRMKVSLKPDAPVGVVSDRLLLRTNDGGGQTVPVLVSAVVEPDIVVTPARVPLGSLQPGQKKVFTVVLRGKKPFEIGSVVCLNHDGVFTLPDVAGAKPVHVLRLTATAPADGTAIDETFEVSIAGRDEPVTFDAYSN